MLSLGARHADKEIVLEKKQQSVADSGDQRRHLLIS
jgi:hypothetical protein